MLHRYGLVLSFVGCSYSPGNYQFIGAQFPTARITTGCVDLGVGMHHASRDQAPVVLYAFGNRCDAPAAIDLAKPSAVGITLDGTRFPLVPRDPRREIGPRSLAAAWATRTAIEYMPADRGIKPVFVEVCVDLTGLVPALTGFEHCFDPRGAS